MKGFCNLVKSIEINEVTISEETWQRTAAEELVHPTPFPVLKHRMPEQKPGRSRQDYCTPDELLMAIKKRLCIKEFAIDLAADHHNHVAPLYYTEEQDALKQNWNIGAGWAFCNPPFAAIAPWVKKAVQEAGKGAQTVMLLPASVGANWFTEYVEPYAYVSYLNPRLVFKGAADPYPKDTMLLFYTPWGFTGHKVWLWSADAEQ